MMKRCGTHTVGYVLLLIGGLNWGLVGLFNFNLLNAILGSMPVVERIVYVLVGVAAVFALLEGKCKMCKG